MIKTIATIVNEQFYVESWIAFNNTGYIMKVNHVTKKSTTLNIPGDEIKNKMIKIHNSFVKSGLSPNLTFYSPKD